jgi:uncharacterized protein (DUF362 family)
MKQLLFAPRGKLKKPEIVNNPYVRRGKVLVSIVGGSEVKRMIKQAVTLIGGFEKIGVKGKTILLKPNAVTGSPNPTTTNPEVVKSVSQLLYEAGAKKVIIGDMSALLTISTKWNMKSSGLKRAAEAGGADLVYFEDHDWVEVELPRGRYIKKVFVSEWIYNVDRVINIPVIKTHQYATYSICLKNFIGATHSKQRPYFVDENHWEEVVSEINQAYQPHLNIVDGTVIMIEGGPRHGTAAHSNVIIASGDRIAADVVGLGVIKSYGKWQRVVNKAVWEQRQIIRALELGLGSDKIELRSEAMIGHNQDFPDLVQRIEEYVF